MTVAKLSLTDFAGLTVLHDAQVLAPRSWTVAQSAWSADILRRAPQGPVLELCAGVGHIGLAAVAEGRRVLVMVDLNPVACDFARRNAAAALMSHRVEVREGRMDQVIHPGEKFALIIADPPWVPSDGTAQFPEDPTIAIDGGLDGLDLARTCCGVIDAHLADGGSAVMQLGTAEQVAAISDHLASELESPLRVIELRQYERGVLALLARRSAGQPPDLSLPRQTVESGWGPRG